MAYSSGSHIGFRSKLNRPQKLFQSFSSTIMVQALQRDRLFHKEFARKRKSAALL
jgi:hypothetical protein